MLTELHTDVLMRHFIGENAMQVEILSDTIRGTRLGLRTKRGDFNAPGAERKSGCKHELVEILWPQLFKKGDLMPISVYQSRMRGLYRAVGFQSNYCKKCVSLNSLEQSWIHAAHIRVI